jgi:LysM repeat protein
MAARFSIANASALLGPNRFNLSIPDLPDVVLPKSYPFKIAIAACACRSLLLPGLGTRVATSVNYTVVSGDTLSHIADELYSGLITYQAIANVSGVVNVDQIFPNQSLSIPIPCACPEDAVLPAPSLPSAAEILSYQVQAGDNLSAIASSYNSSLQAIQSFNPNVSDSSLQQKQILFVPLSGTYLRTSHAHTCMYARHGSTNSDFGSVA